MREKEKDTQSEIKKYDRVMVKGTDEKGWAIDDSFHPGDPPVEWLVFFPKGRRTRYEESCLLIIPDTPLIKLARAVFRAKEWLKRNWRKIIEVDNVFYGLTFIAVVLVILTCMKILSSKAIIIVQ